MKKKKLFIGIGTIILTLLIVCLIGFSPVIYKRLQGNASSFESDNGQAVKTGVVIDTKLLNDGDITSIPLKIYNGSDKKITIKSILASDCSEVFNPSYNFDMEKIKVSCSESVPIELDKQIEVDPYSDYVYNFEFSSGGFSSSFVKLGIKYELDNKTYDLSTYTLVAPGMDFFDEYSKALIINSLNSKRHGSIENLTNFTAKKDQNLDLKVLMPDNEVAMDISENLEDTDMFYIVYANRGRGYGSVNLEVSHPQSQDSLTKNMLGESNQSNISEYFNFYDVNEVKSVSGKMLDEREIASYDSNTGKYKLTEEKDGKKGIYFYLKGTPKKIVEKEKVIPGFYFKEGSSTSEEDFMIYNSGDVPSFTLTVYDKSKLRDALDSWINQFDKKLNEDQVDVESFTKSLYSFLIGANVYVERYVDQDLIDKAVKAINDNPIKLLNKADYTELDKIKNSIDSSNRSYYPEGSFNEIDELLKKYEAGLSENYQVKIDKLAEKLKEKYDALEMLDADYSKVDSAIKTAGLLTNKTDGDKNLYSDESWNNLQNAIKSVVEGKKINEQDVVDGYAMSITKAIADLEYAPADYTELKKIIDDYQGGLAYKNDWYISETKKPVDDYIATITYDKNITEQKVVDKWVSELEPLVKALKLKRALGYYDSDNYEYLKTMNLMSLEGYKNYFESLNKDYYIDESVEIIDEVLESIDDLYKNELTIENQDEFNEYLIQFQAGISMLNKKMGNYDELCKYYIQAFNLNSNYYKDLTELLGVLSDIDFDLKIDEQDKIDSYTKRLKDALNNLELKDADYTEFNKAYEKAKGLNPKHYVDFEAVEDAIKEANRAKNLKIDQQNVVDEATNKLNKAIKGLVLKDANYSQIESLKAVIESLDSSKYTNFDVVKDALDDIVYGKKANEQDAVDEMYNKLKKAYDSLDKVKANYKEVEKAVSNAKKYESLKDNYENYSQLLDALASVNYDLKWDQQDIVDSYVNKINDAIKNLKKKGANYTELEQLVSKVPNDYSNLDKSLRSQIEALLNEARNLPRNLTYEEQYRIDDLVSRLRSLIDKLPKIDKYDNSKEIILSYLKVNGNDVNIKTLPFRYEVGYDVTSANIEVGLASKTSTSKVYGGKVLLPGENNITIIVTTSNKKTYTYNLIITRSTSSNYLKSLKIKQSKIEFNKTKQEYVVKINKDVNKLDLTLIPEDESAKITVKGNKKLVNGGKVYIEVKSQDGNKRVYTLNIQKQGGINIWLIIFCIIAFIITLALVKRLKDHNDYKE